MACEIEISLKDDTGEKAYKQKFLVYETLYLNDETHEGLRPYIEEAKKEFAHKVDSCKVKIKLDL